MKDTGNISLRYYLSRALLASLFDGAESFDNRLTILAKGIMINYFEIGPNVVYKISYLELWRPSC